MLARNTICFWREHDALEAVRMFSDTFPDSGVGRIMRASADCPAGKAVDPDRAAADPPADALTAPRTALPPLQ